MKQHKLRRKTSGLPLYKMSDWYPVTTIPYPLFPISLPPLHTRDVPTCCRAINVKVSRLLLSPVPYVRSFPVHCPISLTPCPSPLCASNTPASNSQNQRLWSLAKTTTLGPDCLLPLVVIERRAWWTSCRGAAGIPRAEGGLFTIWTGFALFAAACTRLPG